MAGRCDSGQNGEFESRKKQFSSNIAVYSSAWPEYITAVMAREGSQIMSYDDGLTEPPYRAWIYCLSVRDPRPVDLAPISGNLTNKLEEQLLGSIAAYLRRIIPLTPCSRMN